MATKQIIEIEVIRAGQPRPYADSFFESILTFKAEDENAKWTPDEKTVREIAKILVHNFEDKPNWHDPELKEIQKIAENKWRVLIFSPFLD